MKRNEKVLIVAGGVISFLIIFLLVNNRDKGYHFKETYKYQENDPYGSEIFYKITNKLLSKNGKFITIEWEELNHILPENPLESSSYIFLGEGYYIDSMEIDRLSKFVYNGNSALIASKVLPKRLMKHIYSDSCNSGEWANYQFVIDTVGKMTLVKNDINFSCQKISQRRKINYRWHLLDSLFLCDSNTSIVPLGAINKAGVNFFALKYGKGEFLFHTVPIAFSNYNLIRKGGKEYAESVFSFLSPGSVYWDEHHKYSESTVKALNEFEGFGSSGGGIANESPLKVIFTSKALSWAWYTGLVACLLYILVKSKRKSRPNPIIYKDKNDMLQNLNDIGYLYYDRKAYKEILLRNFSFFHHFMREVYGIAKLDDDESYQYQVKDLNNESKMLIEELISYEKRIASSRFISEETFIMVYMKMQDFYNLNGYKYE